MKKERGLALAACAALAALMLLFASQCSPLYPINLWDDANCLLTVGRVMRRGGVLYRDIYEQKGPLLYLIHALAACVSDTSFWGVYALEIPALTAALYAAYRLLRLRTGAGFALGAAAVWGALTVTSGSFMRGDSAEEFCLPLLTAALALAYAEYGRRARPMRAKRLLLCGVLAGGVATIKYTLLGAMVGLCAVEGALALKEGGAPRALKSAGVFLAGMAIPILPWAIYFAANGALRDAYTAYIYNNVFLYGGEAASWGQRLGEMARYVQKNALWAVPAALGLAALAADRGETAAVRLCVAAMAVGQFAAVFFVGNRLMLDDGVGPAAYDEILAGYDIPENVTLVDVGCMSLDMLPYVERCDVILTVDAVDGTGDAPGTVYRFEPDAMARHSGPEASLHDLKLVDLFDAASLMGYEAEGFCLGMQVGNPSPEQFVVGLTPECAAALPLLVETVVAELHRRGFPLQKK